MLGKRLHIVGRKGLKNEEKDLFAFAFSKQYISGARSLTWSKPGRNSGSNLNITSEPLPEL